MVIGTIFGEWILIYVERIGVIVDMEIKIHSPKIVPITMLVIFVLETYSTLSHRYSYHVNF